MGLHGRYNHLQQQQQGKAKSRCCLVNTDDMQGVRLHRRYNNLQQQQQQRKARPTAIVSPVDTEDNCRVVQLHQKHKSMQQQQQQQRKHHHHHETAAAESSP
jgi:glutamine amidotransferase-like uncharacterized protein